MPINAVQFTILSIIATGYKVVDAFIYTGVSLQHRASGRTQLLIKRYSMKANIRYFSKFDV